MPTVDREQGGRLVRNAWIEGVKQYFPDTVKESYIAPWEQMRDWEKEIVSVIYQQVRAFILAGVENRQPVGHLTREQGGRLVREIWVGQVYRLIPDPKETYVAPWEKMPSWEQEVDMDMFRAIEQSVLEEVQAA
jgi:hypothetical protein